MKNRVLLLVFITALGLILGGCSSDNNDKESHETTAENMMEATTENITEVSTETTEPAYHLSTREEINTYKQEQMSKYKECFENVGLKYQITVNGCHIVGKQKSRKILDADYDTLVYASSLYNSIDNTMNNAIEFSYELHQDLGVEAEEPHVKLAYEFYKMKDDNPVSYEEFVELSNEAFQEKSEDPFLYNDIYKIYIEDEGVFGDMPKTLHILSYESIPCEMEVRENERFLELDSMEEREKIIAKTRNYVQDSDFEGTIGFHDYANTGTRVKFDNELGLVTALRTGSSLGDKSSKLEKNEKILEKAIQMFSGGYILDQDVTPNDLAKEIISLCQIDRFSSDHDLYMHYDPDEFHKNEFEKEYGYNPLLCDQYSCLSFERFLKQEYYSALFYVPVKVQGLKNK